MPATDTLLSTDATHNSIRQWPMGIPAANEEAAKSSLFGPDCPIVERGTAGTGSRPVQQYLRHDSAAKCLLFMCLISS